jgi:hypothetical protein
MDPLRWLKTEIITDDEGNPTKQLIGSAEPTEAEKSKAEHIVQESNEPFIVWWSDDILSDETPAMIFNWGSERRLTSGFGIIEKRNAVQSETTTYGQAKKISRELRSKPGE